MRSRCVLCFLALSVAALVPAIWLLGCGSHAPTLPSPGPGGGGEDIIEVVDYIVAAREVVSFDRDTLIRASGRAQIDGAVIGADGSGPGKPGVSITIEAEGDVVINGTVRAGNGGQGQDNLHRVTTSGDQTTGGDGGSVTLSSAAGSIALADGAHVRAGDGAGGGDSLTGGAGGNGGHVSLSAPAGTVALAQTDDVVHTGDGGDGGSGSVQGDDAAGFEPPEQGTANGGDGGRLSIEAAQVTGFAIEGTAPGTMAVPASETMLTGGNGGDGGAVVRGLDSGTPVPLAESGARQRPAGKSVTPAQGQERVLWLVAGNGGDGWTPGAPGAGNDAQWRPIPGIPEPHGGAEGGKGGDQHFSRVSDGNGGTTPVVPERRYVGGNGGHTRAIGFTGAAGGPCQPGGDGGSATARGGDGGRVVEEEVGPGIAGLIAAGPGIRGGNGGSAVAIAGSGGFAGNCCDPPGTGQRGGHAGLHAEAYGGSGADQSAGTGGTGGDATGESRDGGRGGDGSAPARGGDAGGSRAEEGGGGYGTPPGRPGHGSQFRGYPGLDGDQCPNVPPPTEGGYHAVVYSGGSNY
ncbi:MAG TPA: hypothetical protein VM283_04195, partial [Armatimonadota bacterium]|nr:hypothetical protein [Armatimonadota bacterium]